MPANKTATANSYTVWSDGEILKGSAEDILGKIQAEAREDSRIKRMSVDGYANALIGSADTFIPKEIFDFLKSQDYDSKFDRALEYLAAMPSSGLRILAKP